MSDGQRDWDRAIQAFHIWVKASCSMGTLGAAETVNAPFMPLQKLEKYLKEGSRTRDLVQALFPGEVLSVQPEAIWHKCIQSFATLLLIGKGEFIRHFVQHDSLRDGKLPFTSCPSDFPTDSKDPGFFEKFRKQQWTFCPHSFRKIDVDIEIKKECILPIIHKELIGTGGSAYTYKIKLAAYYDDLTPSTHWRRDPKYRFANTYALKTYRSKDAKEHYTNEVRAFQHLAPSGALGTSVIGFYGSYVQDGTYNVLLEYADRKTLGDYLQSTEPPSSGEDIKKFWTSMFNLVKALMCIHSYKSDDQAGPRVIRGWHQDVKPANILVISSRSDSAYDCEFRLADLGLSHFRQETGPQGSDTDRDTSGTREYGAPECYRFDHIIDHLPLNVKQTVDIWSLGCIFSEIAVWVVLGRARLIKYRDMRKEETSRIHGHRDRGCFHDSDGAVLTSVKSMHDEVFENVRNSDHITKSVIKKLCDEMLDIVEGRPDAQQCWRKAQRILEDAETKLRKPRSVSLMPGYPPGGLSPRLPPRLPPKEDEPTPWTFEPKGKGRSSTVDIQRRRTLNPDENSKYGSDLVMQPSLVITPPTSPLVRARSDLEQGTSDEAEKPASQISGLGIRETSTSAEGVAQSDDLVSRGDPTPGQYLKQTAKTETTPPLPQVPSRPKLAEWKLADAYMWMTEKKQGRESFNSMPNRNELNSLGLRDQVFVVDNAASMKPYWTTSPGVVYVIRVLAYILKEYDKDGMDLYFTRSLAGRHYNAKTAKALVHYVESARLDGYSDMASTLSTILYQYENALREYSLSMPKRWSLFGRSDGRATLPKPLNVYVLTDGVWQPDCDVKEPIESLVKTMKELGYPRRQVGIQFVRFGNNVEGMEKLRILDDELGLDMDIVDTEPADGNILKMLIGAVNKWADKQNDSTTPARPG